ncbi:MAG: hypothetical protein ABJI96_02705 [Paracoccaceae bacterium]
MATKKELESEVERLRAQSELLRSHADETSETTMPDEPQAETDVTVSFNQILEENGIDGTNVEVLRAQLTDEVVSLHKQYPMAILLSVFVLGCIVGRTFK